jgi:beta-phosphoglucomutase-like phosphatase (HAD superfamily)
MSHFGIGPEDTVIFEDSEIGLRSAFGTGAKVEKVINRRDIYFDRIDRVIHEA